MNVIIHQKKCSLGDRENLSVSFEVVDFMLKWVMVVVSVFLLSL